jgi:hypothetical protein
MWRELLAYDRVLAPLGFDVPRCYGVLPATSRSVRGLVIEYLPEAYRLDESPDERDIVVAARWIGAFHRAAERLVAATEDHGLPRYGSGYLRHWVDRAVVTVRAKERPGSWLLALREAPDRYVEPLLDVPSTVVHGEFYPKNIMMNHGRAVPVDWETSAVAAGEIDLASLTERWPADTATFCEREYRDARWPDEPPPQDVDAALQAARVYWMLRWLGDASEQAEHPSAQWRLPLLEAAVERLLS